MLVFNVTDDKGVINFQSPGGLPSGSTLVRTPKSENVNEFSFIWDVTEVTDVTLSFEAADEQDATSVYNVQVHICVVLYVCDMCDMYNVKCDVCDTRMHVMCVICESVLDM